MSDEPRSGVNRGIQANSVKGEIIIAGDHASATVNKVVSAGGTAPLLDELLAHLKQALAAAPPAKREDAEAMQALAEDLAQSAGQAQANPKLVALKAESVKAAAGNLAETVPGVQALAEQIAQTAVKGG